MLTWCKYAPMKHQVKQARHGPTVRFLARLDSARLKQKNESKPGACRALVQASSNNQSSVSSFGGRSGMSVDCLH